MGKSRRSNEPQTFFLNATHELGRGTKTGGGRAASYGDIDWGGKGVNLKSTLEEAVQQVELSNDPLKQKRFFFLARPEEIVEKTTESKAHPSGIIEEETDFSKKHSRVFSRLGIDLIEVSEKGDAIIHATPEKVSNLSNRMASLGQLGVKEQGRWAQIKEFDTIPPQLRIDNQWIAKSKGDDVLDVVVELQPVLSRLEVDVMFRAIADLIMGSASERLIGNGKDFSGRSWLRCSLAKKTISKIAKDFYSVQSLHEPIYAVVAGGQQQRKSFPAIDESPESLASASQIESLPTVAVFDDGVPSEHRYLAKFRRGEFYAPATGAYRAGSHGSKVASRIVFGEQDFLDGIEGLEHLNGGCQFLDVNVAGEANTIHEKSVPAAMEAIAGAYRDVRVYNFSFSAGNFDVAEAVKLREQLLMTQDVDNFIFENDVIVVVCAGNSPAGVAPNSAYPSHVDDPNWKVGHWASGFNTLVSGAYVNRLNDDAIVTGIGWPSPFTKIGPGLTRAPVPNFCATGGNRGLNHSSRIGLGVSVCNEFGQWEDASGTSFSVPITARQAAFALLDLSQYCEGDTRPFGVTAKAFLALTASHPTRSDAPTSIKDLSKRTLGRGIASAERIDQPDANSAVFLWQGILESPRDKAQIQFPIPLDWLNSAEAPMLRLICSADVPVNEAIRGLWACRRLNCILRKNADNSRAWSSKRSPYNYSTYPLIEKLYDLKKTPVGVEVDDDTWIVEFSYDEIADYPPAMEFSPQQRVAFAAELFDASEQPTSPQQYVQALPVAAGMTFLSVSSEIKVPIIIRR